MKKLLIALTILLSGCTTNQLRVAYHVTNAVDYVQTEQGLDRGCTEGNWVLGKHPDDATLTAFAVAQSALAEVVCGNAGSSEKFCWGGFLAVKLITVGWNDAQKCN